MLKTILMIFKQFSVILFQDVFSISEGIDGTVKTYTFHLTYSNSKCDNIITIRASSISCESMICSYTLETLTSHSCFDDSSHLIVTVFASNILGDGLPSNALSVGKYGQWSSV